MDDAQPWAEAVAVRDNEIIYVGDAAGVESLVRGFTIDAAYQMHMEDQIGSLEVGKKADLIVLDQNIFEVDAYDIHKTQVIMTMTDGDIVCQLTME